MADPQQLYNLLNEIYLILDDGNRRFFSRFNLTVPRFYALLHLGEQPGLSFSELSELMLCDKSNITRIIRGMEADGLVVRRPHETDGRTLRLFLSQAGEELRHQVTAAHEQFNQARFDALEGIMQDSLLAELLRLKKSLRTQLDGGATAD
ncbi:MAG: MarR family transcriptional regulator [Chloroflexi bacterium]|nr:MarR family transcriptional regulator [Chloroflexota bacterium]MCI0574769.1 MarR family transcriptional regulator [Chloroflexota bacterium]MCI0646408.1 MarR family transcriptional regulator [Chloroflexota bacterium]MCI0725509.1 MarR family transcriptional regulator [Chloroflexota bacterium]